MLCFGLDFSANCFLLVAQEENGAQHFKCGPTGATTTGAKIHSRRICLPTFLGGRDKKGPNPNGSEPSAAVRRFGKTLPVAIAMTTWRGLGEGEKGIE